MTARSSSFFVCIALSLPIAACATDGSKSAPSAPTVNRAYVTEPASIDGEILCPISGEIVTIESPHAWYGVYPVYCSSVENARQFAALPKEKRAKLAVAQVLPQKRIKNSTCPLTGDTLTAAAAPVLYSDVNEEVIIGFASLADANQFTSLTPKKKKECIEAWRAPSSA
ncbi:MAG: hypothetical protein SGJ09_15095 [Phycisphaerae bacterium]|nr:hypothetical protein [Phycisphaerae bacterium]